MNRYLLANRALSRWQLLPRPRDSGLKNLVCFNLSLSRRRNLSFFSPDWHNHGFMNADDLNATEAWFKNLSNTYPDEVDAEAYAVVLRSIAASMQPGSPQRAEELVNRMKIQPTDQCYQSVLEAWANNVHEDYNLRVVRAERWFAQIREPTLESYHILLDVLSQGGPGANNKQMRKQAEIDHATKCEQVLQSMTVTPDTTTFNYVIRAWLRVRTDPVLMNTKVKEWLMAMEAEQQKNPAGLIQPNTKSYTMGMESCSILAGHRVKTRTGDGLQELKQLDAILKYMHDLHSQDQPEVVPDTVVYNVLLSTYARLSEFPIHKDAPLKAEKVLRRMMASGKDIAPNHLSFGKVILAWSNVKRPTSGERAIYWLEKLWELYEEEGRPERLQPKVGTYNVVIKANQHDPWIAERIFEELLNAEKDDTGGKLRPTTESFSFLIHSWVQHDLSRASMWLDELINRESNNTDVSLSITTTPDFFQAIIKHASRNPSIDNLILAIKVFDKYRLSRHPIDVHSYSWLIKLGLQVYAEPEQELDRQKFIAEVIEDCRRDGLISKQFMRELGNGTKHDLGLMEKYFADWPLPTSWTRNVPQDMLPKQSDTM
jgi:hypothetical protein